MKKKSSRPHSCNVLALDGGARHLWQFATGGSRVTLASESGGADTGPLPARAVAKDWRTLMQPRLNVAWLPAEHVFLRVVQLPGTDFAELQSMVEFQLEKLSPLPVAQIVWSLELLGEPRDNLQTLLVVIAAREAVEEFLGRIEQQGYQPDRLEAPFVHQLMATRPATDSTDFFPVNLGGKSACLIAWWCGGVLRDLNLVHLPDAEDRARLLRAQLDQMAWSGELEGWLVSTPGCRLIAGAETATAWEPVLHEVTGQLVEIVEPPAGQTLASHSAARAAQGETQGNLLPPEYAARYRQKFVDGLWMKGLGAVLAVYLLGVLVYFATLEYYRYQQTTVAQQAGDLGIAYTNTLKIKAQAELLQEQVTLRFAALDCWKAASELLPADLSLTSFSFSRGRAVGLFGLGPADAADKVTDYNEALRKYAPEGAAGTPLFKQVDPPRLSQRGGPQGNQVTWSFTCELRRAEAD
jgi:hypothetical protein